MTRINFIYELEQLNKEFIAIGKLLEESFDMTVQSIDMLDKDIAREVIEKDDAFDDQNEKITTDCIALIVKQQPIAKDVRSVVAIMRASKEIEKMADHCENICKYIIMLCKQKEIETPETLQKMIDLTRKMVLDVIENFITKDMKGNKEIIDQEKAVNQYFCKLRDELVLQMQEHTSRIPQLVDYLMIARSINRMADHSINIAKWIRYIVTGELLEV
ncbi:MAG: phosphate signaling complex protein PhoU [Lachnospiraceae bacterium]|nr:phosphate signaling complex protein PhoU [Lachnospiraceae bacterium]